jgi:hypothetical protein
MASISNFTSSFEERKILPVLGFIFLDVSFELICIPHQSEHSVLLRVDFHSPCAYTKTQVSAGSKYSGRFGLARRLRLFAAASAVKHRRRE